LLSKDASFRLIVSGRIGDREIERLIRKLELDKEILFEENETTAGKQPMNRCPKIGDRVRYKGGLVVGPCTGTVLRIYERDTWAEDIDWDAPDVIPGETIHPIGLAPERDWQIAMKCDERPSPWCYGDDLVFAPQSRISCRSSVKFEFGESIEERRDAVLQLTADGHSNREIANVLGVDEGTVRHDKAEENSAPLSHSHNEINGLFDGDAENSAFYGVEAEADEDDTENLRRIAMRSGIDAAKRFKPISCCWAPT
jgi:hypothetical protein